MRISGTEPSTVILSKKKCFLKLKNDAQKCQNKLKPKGMVWFADAHFNKSLSLWRFEKVVLKCTLPKKGFSRFILVRNIVIRQYVMD